MPIFEFTCQNCNTSFEELFQSAYGGQSLACPHCGSTRLLKQMSTFSGRVSPGRETAPRGGCATGSCCFGDSCGVN